MTVRDLRYALEQQRGQVKGLKLRLAELEHRAIDLSDDLKFTDEARMIIQIVAQITQQELEYHISEVVNLAQAAVFDDPYKLDVKFVLKRGRSECELNFKRDDVLFDPLTESGGGAVDIGAFSLRVAMWLMHNPRSRAVLILDEPFPRLKGEIANIRALEMVRKISHEMGIQIIMISDERAPIDVIRATSDRLFRVVKTRGAASVETVEPDRPARIHRRRTT